MVQVKVRDKITSVERVVTQKAYSLIKKRYEVLGYVDEEGNEVDGPQAVTTSKKKEDAEPAVKMRQKPGPKPKQPTA